jgi:TPR repeat protein
MPITRYITTHAVPSVAAILFSIFSGGCSVDPGMSAYREGEYGRALQEFRAQDDADGEFAVGLMHYKGEGAARNPAEATVWLRRAADHGYSPSDRSLRKLGKIRTAVL